MTNSLALKYSLDYARASHLNAKLLETFRCMYGQSYDFILTCMSKSNKLSFGVLYVLILTYLASFCMSRT